MVTASSFSLKNFIASSRISLDQELSSVILVNASLPQIPSKTREALKESPIILLSFFNSQIARINAVKILDFPLVALLVKSKSVKVNFATLSIFVILHIFQRKNGTKYHCHLIE